MDLGCQRDSGTGLRAGLGLKPPAVSVVDKTKPADEGGPGENHSTGEYGIKCHAKNVFTFTFTSPTGLRASIREAVFV